MLFVQKIEYYWSNVTPHVVELPPTLRKMGMSRIFDWWVNALQIFVELSKEPSIFDGRGHAEVLLTKQVRLFFEVKETFEVDIEKVLTEGCSLLHPDNSNSYILTKTEQTH